MKKILIVEDEKELAGELKVCLQNAGYEAFYFTTFDHVVEDILQSEADLVLLDSMLPHKSGELILKEIRKQSNIPIIMVTSKNTDIDEVISMSYGADDYITKPYHPTLLLLHIEAIFKRLKQTVETLSYHHVSLLPERGILKSENKEVYLSKNEMLIFKLLLKQQGKIVSRDEIMTYLWTSDEFVDDNTLTVNISRLRHKLEEVDLYNVIETRKGLGYILL